MGGVTKDDLLDALREAMGQPENADDGFTGTELADMLGRGATAVRKIIKVMLRDGVLERVTVERDRIDGRPTVLTAYRLKKP